MVQTTGFNPLDLMTGRNGKTMPELPNPRHFARDVLAKTRSERPSPGSLMHRAFAHHAPGNRLAHRIT
jgi:hypothetical protein